MPIGKVRKSTVVAGAAAGLLLAWGLGTTPASAASYCGSACDGKDPSGYLITAPGGPSNYYHCADDARTIYSVPADSSHPTVELRYSDRCATAWARVPYGTAGAYGIQIRSYSLNHTWRRTEGGTTSSSGSSWTPMVNDQGLLARACVLIPYGSWTCTAYY